MAKAAQGAKGAAEVAAGAADEEGAEIAAEIASSTGQGAPATAPETAPAAAPATMSFACFVEAIVRCAVERANPRWRRDEDGRLTRGLMAAYLIQVPDCLGRFLHNCVLRFSPRDSALKFSHDLEADEASKALLEQRQVQLTNLYGQLGGVQGVGYSVVAAEKIAQIAISLPRLMAILEERGILGQTTIQMKVGRALTCSLSKEQVEQAAHDAATFGHGYVSDGAGVSALSPDQFSELLARLATLKYGAIPGMSMSQRLAAFFLILLDNEKVENAVDALGAKPHKPEFDPSAEPTLEGLNEVRDCP
jgi:hypothetical protein